MQWVLEIAFYIMQEFYNNKNDASGKEESLEEHDKFHHRLSYYRVFIPPHRYLPHHPLPPPLTRRGVRERKCFRWKRRKRRKETISGIYLDACPELRPFLISNCK